MECDRYERQILHLLQGDGRLSHAELGRRVRLSPTAVAVRIKRLEDAGVIERYVALVDPNQVGLPITAMVTMTCDGEQCRQLPARVAPLPEVIACYRLTGDASAILMVVIASISELEHLVDRLAAFGKPSTAVVLSTSFAARPLPIRKCNLGVAGRGRT